MVPVKPCDSLATLQHELDSIRPVLSLTETEETWDSISKAITCLTSISGNGACNFPVDLVSALRSLSRPINSAMCSERSRLSGAAIDLLSTLAVGLGSQVEPLLPLFFPTLLLLCTRSSKVFVTRSRACILTFINNTQLPSILPFLVEAVKDKSVSLRLSAVEGVLACLNCFNPPDLEKDVRAQSVEYIIRATARDANPDIRKVSRAIFEAYKAVLPGRVDKFVAPLTPVMKKYLAIKPTAKLEIHPTNTRSNLSSSASTLRLTTEIQPTLKPGRSTLHIRSVSSSAISNLGAPRAQNRKETIPSLQTVAVHRVSASRPPVATSQNAPSFESCKRSAQTITTLLSSRGPSRPPSAGAIAPSLHRSNGHVLDKSAGLTPARPPRHDPALSNGPIRPRSDTSEAAMNQASKAKFDATVRIVGGARRVPLPHANPKPTSDSPVNDSLGEAKFDSSAKPTVPLRDDAKLITSSPGESRVPRERTKAVYRPLTKPSASSSSMPSGRKDGRQPAKKGGITQATLAQLSRTKAIVIEKPKETSKPVWGRSASSKQGASIKPLVVKSLKHTKNTMAVSESIPLSPSPKQEQLPNLIPLPPSPTGPGGEPFTDILATMDDELQPVAPGTDSLVTLPDECASAGIIPDLQPPAETTPTSAQIHLPVPAATPISTLLSSIQQGFSFTPCSPLSPPQSYLPIQPDFCNENCTPTPSLNYFGGSPSERGDMHKHANPTAAFELAKANTSGDKNQKQIL